MNKPILPLAIAATMLISPFASAQVSFGGSPVGMGAHKSSLPDAPVRSMPTVDALPLLVEDAERLATGNKRQRFGINHATDLTLDNSGVWSTMPNGDRVWRLGIDCPGAFSVNFEFHTYVVPKGGQVFVYNPMGHVLGSYTAASHPGHTSLGVGLLMGNRITVEYVEPAAVVGQGQLRIGQVTHGYRDSFGLEKGFGASGTCNNNVICPINVGYLDQIRSVARIVVNGGDWCTGQLVDNCAHDQTPYFLTANHCISGSVTNWVFAFNWNSPTCTPTTNTPMNQTVSGATLKAQGPNSDYALLELNSDPPAAYNVFFTGWDKSGVAPTESRAIHHPSGDIKKFSIDEDPSITGLFNGTTECWQVQEWDDGTTEGGSSGSGQWDQNGRLIGQLFGGQANCGFNFNDFYGKFSISYSGMATWLGNCGNTTDGLGGSVSVGEAIALSGVSIYPNPASGFFTVALPNGSQGEVRLRVSDATGRVVMDRTSMVVSNGLPLDMSGASEGLYTLEVMADGLRAVHRLVVQR